jgi:hypothetical protein
MSAQDQSFYSDVLRYFDRAAAFTQHSSIAGNMARS